MILASAATACFYLSFEDTVWESLNWSYLVSFL